MPDSRRRAALWFTAALVAVLAACGGTETPIIQVGSGRAVSQDRNVGEFTEVRVEGDVDVDVEIGTPSTFSVRADDNLIDRIETVVENGTLVVRTSEEWSPTTPATVTAVVSSLERVDLRSAAAVSASGLDGASFEVNVEGAGRVTAEGQVDRLRADLDGAGTLMLDELEATEADVTLVGDGSASLNVVDRLAATVEGGGTVTYLGDPQLESKITGTGEVRRA
jgi:hypothetical protein